jgi:hypothetical protein
MEQIEKKQDPTSPAIAGGAALPGEGLLASTEHMGPRAATFVRQWVEHWRAMTREQFEDATRGL